MIYQYYNANPIKTRMVYDIARLLGRKMPSYDKAQALAHHFTHNELNRILNRVVKRNAMKKRLTLILPSDKV
jgi:hypothetical protein